MLMLTAYMDEIGHSQDMEQKFAGMAGWLAPAYNWEVLEKKWKAMSASLEFNISYFHIKEFAHSKEPFKGWKDNEPKRSKLYGKLILHMETTQDSV